MPFSILKTKLFSPPARSGLVSRPQLIEHLNTCKECKLVLISAPAGFGKTTLMGEWLTTSRMAYAWLSLDENDNDPARFILYFIHALRQSFPDIGSGILATIQSSQFGMAHSLSENLLTELINEIDSIPNDFIIVLDDYHVITESSIQDALGFILDNLPEGKHLVISGRSDPPWPLARLRACGGIVELRSNDLRFSPDEAAAFLNGVMHLQLTPQQVETLEACTEGWIAGLQMAAISMQGRQDANTFIEAFTGSHRFIADFLLEEVLYGLPPATQDFLRKTSILDRFCVSLAAALLGDDTNPASPGDTIPESHQILDFLEHANLFLIPLDDERRWYRYHHLFRDLLRSNLGSTRPAEIPRLHLIASRWLAKANLYEDAIKHAFASQELDWTASLIEQAARQVDIQNKLVVVCDWIDNLPDDLVSTRPWLCVYRAWGLFWTGRRSEVEASLAAAEKALDGSFSTAPDQSPDVFPIDKTRLHISGHISAIRAHLALVTENIPLVLEEGENALALLPEGDEMRCETGVALGGAYWALGDARRSEKAFASARSDALLCGYATMAVPSSCYVGMMQTKQGRLAEAVQTYLNALKLGTNQDGKELPCAGFPNTRLGDLYREQDKLELAEAHLIRGVPQCEQLGQADVLTDGYVCLARLQITRGDLEKGRASLNEAQRVAASTKIDPFVQCWLDECRIRLWLHEHNLAEVRLWQELSGLTPDGELSFHYDLHHINLARVMVAVGKQDGDRQLLEEALTLITRILAAAEEVNWTNETIKCLVLQALALQAMNIDEEALQALIKALHLAMPAGYIRTFLDEGAPMAYLLTGVRHQADIDLQMAAYIDRLLVKLDGTAKTPVAKAASPSTSDLNTGSPYLVEPLTEREIDVLRLLKSGLTSTEMAVELYLSVHTVRTHIKNIYRKLDVNRRVEAIQRAVDIGMI